MAAKRFLGLGFTFAAQDKGLEKKLTKTRDLFNEINRTVTLINRKTSKSRAFSGAAGGGQAKGARGRQSYRTAGQYTGTSDAGPTFRRYAAQGRESKQVKTSESNVDKIRKYSDSLVSDLGVAGKAFEKDTKGIIERALKNGRAFDDVVDDLSSNALRLAKDTDFFSLHMKSLSMTFKYAKEYLSGVIGKLETFFETLGIDFRSMIPKELVAAFGVLKAIIKPLMDAGKSLVTSLTKMVGKKMSNLILGRVKQTVAGAPKMGNVPGSLGSKIFGAVKEGGGQEFSSQKLDQIKASIENLTSLIISSFGSLLTAIGQDLSLPSLQKSLHLIYEKLLGGGHDDEKKSGIGAKIAGALAAIPIIGYIAKKLYDLYSALKEGKAVADVLTKGKNILSGIFEFIEGLEIPGIMEALTLAWNVLLEGLATAAELFFDLIAPLVAIGAFLYGFGKTLWEGRDSIMAAFTNVGLLIVAIGENLWTRFKIAFGPLIEIISSIGSQIVSFLAPVLTPLMEAFKPLIDLLSSFKFSVQSVIDLITQAVSKFVSFFTGGGINLGKLVTMGAEAIGSFAQVGLSNVKSDTAQQQKILKDPNAMNANRISTLSDMSNQTALDQLAAQKSTNELLEKLVDAKGVGKGSAIPVSVDIKTDSKYIGAKVRSDEVDRHNLNGVPQ